MAEDNPDFQPGGNFIPSLEEKVMPQLAGCIDVYHYVFCMCRAGPQQVAIKIAGQYYGYRCGCTVRPLNLSAIWRGTDELFYLFASDNYISLTFRPYL